MIIDDNVGFHSHGGTPIARWMRFLKGQNPNRKWMRTAGTHILGNLHMDGYHFVMSWGFMVLIDLTIVFMG